MNDIKIVGSFDKDTIYCAGSLTKFLTTFVTLSLLAEDYDLTKILDDENFLDELCGKSTEAKDFLLLFQKIIGSQFTLRDLCSYYSGLPYTFDVATDEVGRVDQGNPFKHHCIKDEKTFLSFCKNNITPVFSNRCKFHYSEIAIIFLGYLIEKIYQVKMEMLYRRFLIDKYDLKHSEFSRTRVKNVYIQDLSDRYDYPAIASVDHGFFCYSNGFYTTLNDMKKLLEQMLDEPIFKIMVDIKNARAASPRIMNGLSIELRQVHDDLIYGYEGLSFSGCNLWAFSTKQNIGYLTFSDSEEEVYEIIYDQLFKYTSFDQVPEHTQKIYKEFIKHFHAPNETKEIPLEFQGEYHRVKINVKELSDIFHVGDKYIIIRNPDEIKYDVIFANDNYRIKGKDNLPGAKVGFLKTNKNLYMYMDGTLYRKIS